MPKGLKAAVGIFVKAIYENIFMTPHSFLGEIIQARVESSGSHLCSKPCLENIPIQTCTNVCGVAVAILGRIACAAPSLWRDINLSPSLKWLLSPSDFSDFLRCCIISWLLKDSIDMTSIGVADKNVPPQKGRNAPGPRFRHVRETITISDDEVDDGGWIKVKYGKKRLYSRKKCNQKWRRIVSCGQKWRTTVEFGQRRRTLVRCGQK